MARRLIQVRKIATGAGPLLLDEKDPRIGTVFEAVGGPAIAAPAAAPARGNDLRAYGGEAPKAPAKGAAKKAARQDVSAYDPTLAK